jgi:hypothetical protein
LRSLGLRCRTVDDKHHCPVNGGRDVLGADFAFAQVALAHKFLLPHLAARGAMGRISVWPCV